MTTTIIIDLGNYSSKFGYKDDKGEVVIMDYPSVVHKYKDVEGLKDANRIVFGGIDNLIGEGVKDFYAGKETMMYSGTIRKGHNDGLTRLVNALYLVNERTGEHEFNLVVTSPFKSIAKDTTYFKEHVLGEKSAFVNGKPFNFNVKNLIGASEGLGATHFTKHKNFILLDAGSMTMNILEIVGGNINKDESKTLNYGTVKYKEVDLADIFFRECSSVDFEQPIVVTGGRALEMKLALESIGYENVSIAKSEKYEQYHVNCEGLILKYGEKFEGLFKE